VGHPRGGRRARSRAPRSPVIRSAPRRRAPAPSPTAIAHRGTARSAIQSRSMQARGSVQQRACRGQMLWNTGGFLLPTGGRRRGSRGPSRARAENRGALRRCTAVDPC
jgi:hypothetical protein